MVGKCLSCVVCPALGRVSCGTCVLVCRRSGPPTSNSSNASKPRYTHQHSAPPRKGRRGRRGKALGSPSPPQGEHDIVTPPCYIITSLLYLVSSCPVLCCLSVWCRDACVTPPLSPDPSRVPCLGHLQSTHAALQRHVTQIDAIQAQIRAAAGTHTHTLLHCQGREGGQSLRSTSRWILGRARIGPSFMDREAFESALDSPRHLP